MDKKLETCWCTILMGILVIVFAWWKVSWGAIALTVLGAAVIVKGIVGKCCCSSEKKEGTGCCS